MRHVLKALSGRAEYLKEQVATVRESTENFRKHYEATKAELADLEAELSETAQAIALLEAQPEKRQIVLKRREGM